MSVPLTVAPTTSSIFRVGHGIVVVDPSGIELPCKARITYDVRLFVDAGRQAARDQAQRLLLLPRPDEQLRGRPGPRPLADRLEQPTDRGPRPPGLLAPRERRSLFEAEDEQ